MIYAIMLLMNAKEYSNKIIDMERERDYQGAYGLLQEALTVYPVNTFFLKNEVYILFRLKKIKQARQKAEERILLLKNDPFFLKTYLMILEIENAKEDMERLIEKIPSWEIRNEDFHLFLARLTARVFGQKKAMETLRATVIDYPEYEALKNLLNDWSTGGSLKGGFKHYRDRFKETKTLDAIMEIESIRALPDYADDYQLQLYLAELYKKAKKYDLAIETYKNLLGLKEHKFARKMLGYTYYRLGDIQNAAACLKDAFLDDPYDHYVYRTVAKIFEKRSDYEGFERLVTEALGKKPGAKHLYGLLKRAKKWQKKD